MQNAIKKRAAVFSAAVMILILGAYLAIILMAALTERLEQTAVYVIMGVYALGILAVIVGVVVALRQRLAEIEGGEENVASQY